MPSVHMKNQCFHFVGSCKRDEHRIKIQSIELGVLIRFGNFVLHEMMREEFPTLTSLGGGRKDMFLLQENREYFRYCQVKRPCR